MLFAGIGSVHPMYHGVSFSFGAFPAETDRYTPILILIVEKETNIKNEKSC